MPKTEHYKLNVYNDNEFEVQATLRNWRKGIDGHGDSSNPSNMEIIDNILHEFSEEVSTVKTMVQLLVNGDDLDYGN